MTQFVAPNPVSREFYLSYPQMSEQDLSKALKYSLEQQNYGVFWSITTYAVSKTVFEKNIPNILSYFFQQDFSKLNNISLTNFIHGFVYFIQNQKVYTSTQILDFLSGQENEIFSKAITLKDNDYLDSLFPFCTQINLENFNQTHIDLIKKQDFNQIEMLYKYCNNIDYNNGEIIHSYFLNGIKDFNFIKKIIEEYKLDINSLASYNGLSLTISQQLLNSPSSVDLVHDFISYFGEKIDCDIEGNNNNNVFNFLHYSTRKIEDMFFCYGDLLTYCQLKEKNIAQIINQVLEPQFVSQLYDHVMYDKLFNHTSFNSKYFDRSKVLQQILLLDNNNLIIKTRNDNKNTINPITILLDKFYKSEQPYQVVKNQINPFVYWGETQNENFNYDTCKYLLNKYKNETLKLPSNKFKNFDNSLKQTCKNMGLNNVALDNILDKFFHKNKLPIVVQEINTIPIDKESFNQSFIQQIQDAEISKYIQSIKLNSQQYLKIFNEIGNPNVHYMQNLIPKFVNNSIGTYLHFSTLDPNQAKESILVQFKLLNKKTFDILNEELENQKEKALRDISIQKKIIENY